MLAVVQVAHNRRRAFQVVGPAWAAALVAPILPLTGYVALHFAERFDRVMGATRALAILLFRRRAFLRLTAERHDIRRQILDLGREVDGLLA